MTPAAPGRPPRTFHEALQGFYFVHLAVIFEDPDCGNCPGRLDYLLWPYLERDLAAGRATLEQAKELVDELFIRFEERLHGEDLCVEAIMTGGIGPDGRSSVNPLSHLLVHSIGALDQPHPAVYTRLSKDGPESFFDLSVNYLLHGRNRAQIFSDDACVSAIVRSGASFEDAAMYMAAVWRSASRARTATSISPPPTPPCAGERRPMLPRERVFAALEHREPDRIPWGEHSIDFTVYEDILGRPTFVQSKMREIQAFWDGRRDEIVEGYKRDRLDLVRALEMDIVTVGQVPPKGYRPTPMEKLDHETYRDEKGDVYRVSVVTHDLRPYRRTAKNYVAPTVESLQAKIDALDRGVWTEPDESCWELVRHAIKEMKKTHFVLLIVGDLEFPRFGATEEESWMNLILQPEICVKVAELRGKEMLRELQTVARLGVDGIMPAGDLGSSTNLMASPEIYRTLVYPWHKRHVAEAHRLGLKVLKHCCGHTWPIIEELAEVYDAYESIQASAGMDIKALKERVENRLCLWGGIWHEHIVLGSRRDIIEDVRHAFQHAAPGGGYIMGSSHSLSVGAKKENILTMKRCRDEWGAYPIEPKRFRDIA